MRVYYNFTDLAIICAGYNYLQKKDLRFKKNKKNKEAYSEVTVKLIASSKMLMQ